MDLTRAGTFASGLIAEGRQSVSSLTLALTLALALALALTLTPTLQTLTLIPTLTLEPYPHQVSSLTHDLEHAAHHLEVCHRGA